MGAHSPNQRCSSPPKPIQGKSLSISQPNGGDQATVDRDDLDLVALCLEAEAPQIGAVQPRWERVATSQLIDGDAMSHHLGTGRGTAGRGKLRGGERDGHEEPLGSRWRTKRGAAIRISRRASG